MLVDGHIDTLVRVRLRIFANDLVQVLAEEEAEHVGKFAIQQRPRLDRVKTEPLQIRH